VKTDGHVRERGLRGSDPLIVYTSTEGHSCIQKAIELLGIGHAQLRRIPVDGEWRMDVGALQSQIAEDRAEGLMPACVAASAGTVNTGAIDPLDAIADLCRREDLWFHVDGAFGALAYLSPALRPIVAGLERADSIGFDLHKWGSLPFECACVLVRDPEMHRAAFATTASYIAAADRGVIAGGLPFSERGLELTRGFKALKAWMSLTAHGSDALAAVIEQNVRQAHDLARRVMAHEDLELLAPVPLNIVCFRFVAPGLSDARLNAVNEEILLRLQERGIAVPSGTKLGDKYAIRVANVNHRSVDRDFVELVDAVVVIGGELIKL
jgi:glutamate/tyrosine decarboxylase-like PLP-dependent enzyme